MKRDLRLSAFTLIELLVVISIIALLVSILMPGLSNARNQAKKIVCSSQMKQLGIAHLTYSYDYDDYIVPSVQDNGTDEYWFNTLGPYFEHNNIGHGESSNDIGKEMLLCPMDKKAYPKMLNPHSLNPGGWLSYALNSQPVVDMSSSGNRKKYAGVGGNKLCSFRQGANVMLHVDYAYRAWICDSVALTLNMYSSEPSAHYDKFPGIPQQNELIDSAYRHNDKTNILWLDGHVSDHEKKLASASENKRFWGNIYCHLKKGDVDAK